MNFRNIIRYFGLMCMMALYIGSGIQKLADPSVGAALLAKSNFPYFLSLANIHLYSDEYRMVIQATGAIFLSFSLFILLGVGRSFFAFLLAVGTAIITVCFFVNIENPAATSEENIIHIMSNTAIIGGLLFVAGSGHPSRRYSQARARAEADHPKKRQ